jgi:protein-L-isoaspartate(D-aspartate) O-methyltransferase
MNRCPWKIKIVFVLILAEALSCRPTSQEGVVVGKKNDSDPEFNQRQSMVDDQIKARGVKDERVLQAMRTVRRHQFVPDEFQEVAYGDEPLPIGHDQTISQPYIVAFMTEALNLKGAEKVLEIGTGSGYQAAVLAEVTKDVYTIEIVESLAIQARQTLVREGYGHVQCRCGDGYDGWPEAAPFDAIIITAAPSHVPEKLLDQLKEGGRMVVPVGTWSQELVRFTKRNGQIREERLIPVRFVPMTGKIQQE